MKKHLDMGRIVYDPKDIPVNEDDLASNANWKDFHGDVREELPSKMTTPLGNLVTINVFVNANHAGKHCHLSFTHRYYHLCAECPYYCLFEMAKHSGSCYIWK
jgi:hypothetical protein